MVLLNLHLESPSCLLLFWLLDAVIHQMRIYVHDLFLYRLIIVALVVVVVCAHPCGTAKWDVPAGQIILGHKRGGGGQQMGGEKGLGVIEVTFSSAVWSRATFLLTPLVRKEKKKKNNGATIKYIEWSDRRYGQELVLFFFKRKTFGRPSYYTLASPFSAQVFIFFSNPSPADVFLCVVYLRVTSKPKFFFQLYVQR